MTNYNFDKGRQGEERVAKVLVELGFKTIHVGGAVRYSIDGMKFFCADLLPYQKGFTFWVQVKYKEPRHKYPDTGLELWRYKKLQEHQAESGRPVLVLFTDDSGTWGEVYPHLSRSKLPRIYGEWLDNLQQCSSSLGHNWNSKDNCPMIYFLLGRLKNYHDLLEAILNDAIKEKASLQEIIR